MLEGTQKKGTITQLHCIMDLTNIGIRCLVPVDECSKYDIVADLNGKFIRIQCKTACWSTDTKNDKVAFNINTFYQTINTKQVNRHKYSKKDIDYFYTWFNGKGYLVSIEEATGTVFRWRYEYPSNGQKQKIHIAENYEIEKIIKNIENKICC